MTTGLMPALWLAHTDQGVVRSLELCPVPPTGSDMGRELDPFPLPLGILVFPPFLTSSLYELYLITPLDGFLKHAVLVFL